MYTFIMYNVHMAYICSICAELQCATIYLTYFSYDYGSIQVYCVSSVKIMRVPQAMSQLFAILLIEYTLSIITSQLHCFQLRNTLNGKDFNFFFLMGYARRSRTSFFNTCVKINLGHNLEPHFRVTAYFHIYWSK